MSAGRDPHAEGMFWLVVLGVGAIVMLTLAGIGIWTVWGWLI